MKKVLLFSTLFLVFQISFANPKLDKFFTDADAFFKKNVANGLVNYKAIKQNPAQLNSLVNQISTMHLHKGKSNTNLAFLINSYNILVIKGVIRNYPLKSPLDVDGFFDKKLYTVAGEEVTLNKIENEKIRPVYLDSRIHFVLVCAAKGCPKIMPYAYKPTNVIQKMEARTKAAINDPQFIRVKPDAKLLLISEIFKWYKEDFVKEKKSLRLYVNSYQNTEKRKAPSNFKVDYYPYNWKLNEQ